MAVEKIVWELGLVTRDFTGKAQTPPKIHQIQCQCYLEDALNPLKRRHHHKQRGARVDRSELPIHNACMPPRMMIGP